MSTAVVIASNPPNLGGKFLVAKMSVLPWGSNCMNKGSGEGLKTFLGEVNLGWLC